MNLKPKLFVTRELPAKALDILRERTELIVNMEDRALTKEQLIHGVRGADALLCLLTDPIDAEVMDAAPGLKVIANYAVGYNNIDVASATERGIAVTNTPGVLTEATADMAFALLMAAARRIVEGDRLVRAGEWEGWGPMQLLGTDIFGATLGLIGLGRIGKAVAKRAQGFGMNVLYWNRTRLQEAEEAALGVQYASIDEIIAGSDYISLHIAYTSDTHHLIGSEQFAKMKPSAILINTARGAVVDESALVKALRDQTIAGAGLDVYEREPALEPGLAMLDNVVLAPHLGSATLATRTKMGVMAADNVLEVLDGRVPPNLVNTQWRAH